MMRRPSTVLVAALFLVASLLPSRPAAAGTRELIASLDALVSSFAGVAGLWISDPNSSQPLYAVNEDVPVVAASLYKLALLLEVERLVEAGTLSYQDTVTIEDEDVTEDGSYELPGTVMTMDQALEAMITISDNGAALALWHTLGPAQVNATLVAQGVHGLHVALDDSEENVTSARAIGTFFTRLARRELVSVAASERMLARLTRQQINDRLPAQLPSGTVVAHKTGNLSAIVHDSGIITTPFGSRVVVALTWNALDDVAAEFIADVGSLVYAAVLEPPATARFVTPNLTAGDVGATVATLVKVANAGAKAWAAGGSDSFGLIWEIKDAAQQVVRRGVAPIPLGAVEPGVTRDMSLPIPVPDAVGEYTVVVGLADASGRPLAPLGAGIGTFPLRAHLPFLATAVVQVPLLLHQGEVSLVVVQYASLPAAGSAPHELSLTYQISDPLTNVLISRGTIPLGTLWPGRSGRFFAQLVAPEVTGIYRIDHELSELGRSVGAAASVVTTIGAQRSFGGDDQRLASRPSTRTVRPSAPPGFRLPTINFPRQRGPLPTSSPTR